MDYANEAEYGTRNGNCPSGVCGNPHLTVQPTSIPPESGYFTIPPNLWPMAGSPLLGAGATIGGLTTDIYGQTRPSPPSIGAAEVQGTPPTPGTGGSGNITITANVTFQ